MHDCAAGNCPPPTLGAIGCITQKPTGEDVPYLLMVSYRTSASSGMVEEIMRRLRLLPGFKVHGAPGMLHLVDDTSVTLALDLSRIGPMAVSREWTKLASEVQHAVVEMCSRPIPAGMRASDYIERYGDNVAMCTLPVANGKVAGR